MYIQSVESKFETFIYNSKVMLRNRYNKIYTDEYSLNHGFDKEYTPAIFSRDIENYLDTSVEHSLELTYRNFDCNKPPSLPELTRDSGISDNELFDIVVSKIKWLPKCVYHPDLRTFEMRFWTYWCVQYFLQKINTDSVDDVIDRIDYIFNTDIEKQSEERGFMTWDDLDMYFYNYIINTDDIIVNLLKNY